jgi:signal peptidase I
MTAYEYRPPQRKKRSLLRTRVTPLTAVLVLGSIAVLRIWVVETAYVEGSSMADTLQSGDRVLTLKPLGPERFDIIVFGEPGGDGIDIKRIVGMPGDVVSMVPHVTVVRGREVVLGSDLYVNSQRYDEPYTAPVMPTSLGPIKVPRDSYFVLGDHRDASVDSRRYGAVKADLVRGVAVAVVYPPASIRLLGRDEQPTAIAADTTR